MLIQRRALSQARAFAYLPFHVADCGLCYRRNLGIAFREILVDNMPSHSHRRFLRGSVAPDAGSPFWALAGEVSQKRQRFRLAENRSPNILIERTPEEARAHIQVLAVVLSDDWLRVLRSAMSFSIAEAQTAPELQQAVEAMKTGEAADAWQLLLSKWPAWQHKVRPVVLSKVAANVARRSSMAVSTSSADGACPTRV